MSKFKIYKQIDLNFLGEGWETCRIRLTPLEVSEFEQLQNIAPKDIEDSAQTMAAIKQMIVLLKTHFVDGTGYDGDGIIPISKEDFDELPIEVLNACISLLSGKTDPKS